MKTTGFGFLKTPANFGITRKTLSLTIVENVSYFLIGQVAPDKFAIGYDIFFADGRRAGRLPSLEFGYFVREREAKLYFLGYIKQNRSRFLPSTIEAVDDLIRTIIQPGLF